MNKEFIQFVKKILNRIGVDIVRFKDPFNLSLYQKIYTVDILNKKPFYNVGSGDFYHPYWTNLDYISDCYKNIQKNVINHNLMSKLPLPIETGKAKIIYTSHTIEHIKEDAAQVLFNEAYRCLDQGGVFRITTEPDAESDFRALLNNDEDWFYWDKYYVKKGSYESNYFKPATNVPLSERWLNHFASELAPNNITPSKIKLSDQQILELIQKLGFPNVLDYLCSICEFRSENPSNHISWWTHDKVLAFLKNAGFKNSYRSGYGQSCSPLMRNSKLFDSTHPQMSLYVEAVR